MEEGRRETGGFTGLVFPALGSMRFCAGDAQAVAARPPGAQSTGDGEADL